MFLYVSIDSGGVNVASSGILAAICPVLLEVTPLLRLVHLWTGSSMQVYSAIMSGAQGGGWGEWFSF